MALWSEIRLEMRPLSRFEVIDRRRCVLEMCGSNLERFPWPLSCSFDITSGYLDQSFASPLNARHDGMTSHLRAFPTVFPEGAGYQLDELHLRKELSDEQRRTEPRNGNAHLAFIGDLHAVPPSTALDQPAGVGLCGNRRVPGGPRAISEPDSRAVELAAGSTRELDVCLTQFQ
jgi:hypothetical protein